MNLASIQEGEEWISKLEHEVIALRSDLDKYGYLLTKHTVDNLLYAISKSEEAISLISLEISLLEEI